MTLSRLPSDPVDKSVDNFLLLNVDNLWITCGQPVDSPVDNLWTVLWTTCGQPVDNLGISVWITCG